MAAAKRGKKSAAAATTKAAPIERRPEPPADLTEFQANEWRAVVDRMPADWFTRENFPLLSQYVRHIENANKLAKAIEAIDAAQLGTALGLERFNDLTKMAEREGRAMSSLATRLRLTQQSRYNAAKANTESGKAGSGKKPWEFDGEA